MVISCLPRVSAFYGWRCWHRNESYLSLCSSLASRILWLSFSPSLFLLWCWAFSGKNHCRSQLFFGVASPAKSETSLPALLWCRFFVVNLCSVILWCRMLVVEFGNRTFFFFGVDSSVPEITAIPCTSLVLASSATNSTKSAYSSATSWQGWKMKIWATRKVAVKWKNTLLKSSYWLCSPMVVSLPQYE